MAMTVYTNIYSTIAQNNLTTANNSLSKSIERLSSGLRINHASDDASGLAISEKLRGQIRGMSKASMNAQDAVSFLQTAEGGMEVIGDMLQRMRELAVQAGNGTYTSSDRAELQKEVDQLKSEINRVSSATEYNTKKLLSGEAAAIWSASSNDINAIVRGAPAEGNYRLDFDVDPGQNSVYKSNIMTVNRDIAIIKTNSTNIANIDVTGDVKFMSGAEITVGKATAVVTGGLTTVIGGYTTSTAGTSVATSTTSLAMALSANSSWKSGYFQIEFLNNVSAGSTAQMEARLTFIDAVTGARSEQIVKMSATGTQDITIAGMSMTITGPTATQSTNAGDKQLIAVTGAGVRSAGGSFTQITTDTSVSTALNNGRGPQISIDGGQSKGSQTFTVMGLGEDGNFRQSQVTFNTDKDTPFKAGTLTMDVLAKGDVATSDIMLKDLDVFTNKDGRMLLDNTQTITIYGNNKTADITLEGRDSIKDLMAKIQTALAETLDMGGGVNPSDLVQFVDSDNVNGGTNGSVEGTIVMQAGIMGKLSDIKFVGDENVLNALGWTQLQAGRDGDTRVTVTDAHSGQLVGRDTVSDNILRGIIKGVDVQIGATSGVIASADPANFMIDFQPDTTNPVFLHIKDNRTDVQIGANEGQTFDISIAQMDTLALEIDDAFVMTMEDSQKAITKFDQALTKVNSARATIGAQINRLDYTMQNLSISKQNLIASESRIRDLDVAEESATFARNQILVNSAVAMLAQANQLPQTALQLIGR